MTIGKRQRSSLSSSELPLILKALLLLSISKYSIKYIHSFVFRFIINIISLGLLEPNPLPTSPLGLKFHFSLQDDLPPVFSEDIHISYSLRFKIKVTFGHKTRYEIKVIFDEISLKLRQTN